MILQQMDQLNGKPCPCGRQHCFTGRVLAGKGVLEAIPAQIAALGGTRVFVLSDVNTHLAAGEQVCRLLQAADIPFDSYCFPQQALEPDEHSVGAAVMHYRADCDLILGVGSGVINDIGKILSHLTGHPYIIVATAPSMDGYASATSSMTREGLKISLPSRSADVIIGDTEILRQAPLYMLKAGLGDMLAKYVSLCEWRIAQLVVGEYYCPEVAALIRCALQRCVEAAPALLQREEQAVQAVFEGLVAGGVAMNYAGLSRPASGVEHYISHVLDMRGAQLGTPVQLHGLQCAVGTRLSAELYERLCSITPDKETALAYGEAFDYSAWQETLRHLLGKGAESMIALEEKEHKYDPAGQKKRLEQILDNWDRILEIIRQELPPVQQLTQLLSRMDMPQTLQALGTPDSMLPVIFGATRDIRDKYVLSRLAWDLGITDDLLRR